MTKNELNFLRSKINVNIMVYSGKYIVNIVEDEQKGVEHIYSQATEAKDRVYDYEDAVNVTGNGCYNCGLLAVLSLGLLAMGIEIFGLSVIVTGSACDFHLEHWQRSVLLSMPFIGPVLMSITWGYLSDTQGRRKTLLIAMWGSFAASFISGFSLNWIMLAVLKMFSSSFCSAVQSVSYALLNESCSRSVRNVYMLIMTSALMLFVLSYVVPAYFILQLQFSYDLIILTFTPWRLLALLLAAPLGISAFFLHFFYESPKFLLNSGQEEKTLKYLAKIWSRNGKKLEDYPVRKVVPSETPRVRDEDVHILKSFWLQTVPLFKPPLVWRTLQLFYLTAVIYSINNSFVMWMPYIVEAFTSKTAELSNDSKSLCSILISTVNTTVTEDNSTCSSSIESHTLLSGITHGLVFAGINLCLSRLASRKKALMIIFLLIPSLSSLGAVFNHSELASLILYVGVTMTNLCMGVLFSYYVELYPTSYSGMAACLGVMVARLSGLAGVNFVGTLVVTHCTMIFYVFSVYLLSGILVAAVFLPPDVKTKEF